MNWCKLSHRSRRAPAGAGLDHVQTGQRASEIELSSIVPGQIQDLQLILECEVAMPLRSGLSMSRMAVLGVGMGGLNQITAASNHR